VFFLSVVGGCRLIAQNFSSMKGMHMHMYVCMYVCMLIRMVLYGSGVDYHLILCPFYFENAPTPMTCPTQIGSTVFTSTRSQLALGPYSSSQEIKAKDRL
jgi:hypothetical protein